METFPFEPSPDGAGQVLEVEPELAAAIAAALWAYRRQVSASHPWRGWEGAPASASARAWSAAGRLAATLTREGFGEGRRA
jgi:hypothetical protein